MLEKIKYVLRRISQKISRLDADNSSIQAMQVRIDKLESELINFRNDVLYDPSIMISAINDFNATAGFYDEKNIIEGNTFLINLQAEQNIFSANTRVVEFMCGAGEGALFLKKFVGRYHGLDSSGTLLKFAMKNIASEGFQFSNLKNSNLKAGSFDVAIISASQGRWSLIALETFAKQSAKILTAEGVLVVELPYADNAILEVLKSSRFKSLDLVTGKINYIIAKKDLCPKFPQPKQSITKINIGTTIN